MLFAAAAAAVLLMFAPGAAHAAGGDLNNDVRVDLVDLAIILANWGTPQNPRADLNGDGATDILDYTAWLAYWIGQIPGGTATSTSLPQCSDAQDNDNDGKIDFGSGPNNDPGCSSVYDTDETDPPPPPPPLTGSGTVKTAIQQSWVNCEQTAIVEVMSQFDLVQAPLDEDLARCTPIYGSGYSQIAALRQKNPDVIIQPFWSTHYNMPAGAKSDPALRILDRNGFVNTINQMQARGFDGMYVDLWNLFNTEADAEAASDLLRATWPAGIHIVNPADGIFHSYDMNGFMFEDASVEWNPNPVADGSAGAVLGYAQEWAANGARPSILIVNERCLDAPDTFSTTCKGITGGFWPRMRHATALSLLADNLYVMANYGGGGSPHWAVNWRLDEWKVDLGTLVGPAQEIPGITPPDHVWVRFFNNGAVILGDARGWNEPPGQVTVNNAQLATLSGYGGPYNFFRGGQQPNVNNGAQFNSITLSTYERFGDSVILVKQPQTVVSDIYIDNAVPNQDQLSSDWENNIQGTWSQSGFEYNYPVNTYNESDLFYDDWSMYPNNDAHWATPGTTAKWAKWTPDIGVAGNYEVFVWYPNKFNTDRAPFTISQVGQSVRYTVFHANGSTPVTVNQQQNGGQWVSLGTYAFNQGTAGYVQVASDQAGYVFADAVKFVWQAN